MWHTGHICILSTWMKNHHLQLKLAKMELMVFPAKQAIHHNININTDSLSLAPSKTARNLWVIIDDQLTFTAHNASVSRSCRFALYNIQPKRAHVTPLLIELHWLPVAARIKFKSLMLAYRVLAGSAPTYLNALVRANVTPRMLRSSSERRLALPSVQVRLICSSTLVE